MFCFGICSKNIALVNALQQIWKKVKGIYNFETLVAANSSEPADGRSHWQWRYYHTIMSSSHVNSSLYWASSLVRGLNLAFEILTCSFCTAGSFEASLPSLSLLRSFVESGKGQNEGFYKKTERTIWLFLKNETIYTSIYPFHPVLQTPWSGHLSSKS